MTVFYLNKNPRREECLEFIYLVALLRRRADIADWRCFQKSLKITLKNKLSNHQFKSTYNQAKQDQLKGPLVI